ETVAGRGRGVLRLTEDADGEWRAWHLLTALQELKGHEQPRGARRVDGMKTGRVDPQRNWLDDRRDELEQPEPYVVIVGSGQCGLAKAATLRLLGVPTLVLERNPRVGDNWRNRYHSLVLHDPVWVDHLPYFPFPDSWPIYTPKDKFGDW